MACKYVIFLRAHSKPATSGLLYFPHFTGEKTKVEGFVPVLVCIKGWS